MVVIILVGIILVGIIMVGIILVGIVLVGYGRYYCYIDPKIFIIFIFWINFNYTLLKKLDRLLVIFRLVACSLCESWKSGNQNMFHRVSGSHYLSLNKFGSHYSGSSILILFFRVVTVPIFTLEKNSIPSLSKISPHFKITLNLRF